MKLQPIVALDIGSTKVACAIGLPREDASGCEFVGSSLIPYPTPSQMWPPDPLTVSRTIEQALEATAVSGVLSRALVALTHPSLSSERIRTGIPLGDEPMTVRVQDLDRLQASALHQALAIDREPLLVERLACAGNGFDGIRDPRGLPATRLSGTFHILTIPMAARRMVIQAVESVGLEVVRLTYSLPATLAGMADERVAQQRVLLIDVGGLTTDVGLFVEGMLQSAHVVAWGGLTLAIAIAKELRVTMPQALAWSLEGTNCHKGQIRVLIERHWESLREAVERLLNDQPHPDAVLLGGRGALIDGFAEWVERTVGMTARLCRSPRTNQLSDLPRQLGLCSAIGLLEMFTRQASLSRVRSARLFDRVIDRTRAVLTEYF